MNPINYVNSLRPKVKNYKDQIYSYAQEKRDGHRLTLVNRDDQFAAITRKDDIGPKLVNTKLGSQLKLIMPPNSVVDGELFLPGKPATSVITALNEDWPDLTFDAFAMPVHEDENMTDHSYDSIILLLRSLGFTTPPLKINMSPDDLMQDAIDRKIEGYVLKNAHYDQWYKLKPQKSVDAFIVGWKRGHGKYLTTTGSLQVAVWNGDRRRLFVKGSDYQKLHPLDDSVSVSDDGSFRVIANVSGMNDQQRDEMFEMAREGTLIGRVLEVEYQSIAAKGKLQFPRFIRWREDKPKDECTEGQL